MYGSFIRAVRGSRGLTQAQVAEIIGTSQPTFSAYEHDRKLPSADTLNKILVGCGYQLTATAGESVIGCPLPRAGWFADEDLPQRDATDLALARSSVIRRERPPVEERARILHRVLALADDLRLARALRQKR
jgi:transcriptional regulator with XRE-family HTH domain